MTVISERLAALDTIRLAQGQHNSPDDGMCLMEAAEQLGELGQDCFHFGIVCRDCAALAQVARCARQDEVGRIVTAARGNRDHMVDVKDAALVIEKLEHAPLRDLRAGGFLAAVLTDPTVALRDFVADLLRYVAGVGHATTLAVRAAKSCAWAAVRDALEPTTVELQGSALALLDRMIDPAGAAA